MDKQIYTIYDKKSEIYGPPFIEVTDGTAIRLCMDLLNNPNTPFNKYPGDYTLVRIGLYDELTGDINGFKPPSTVMELQTINDTKKE